MLSLGVGSLVDAKINTSSIRQGNTGNTGNTGTRLCDEGSEKMSSRYVRIHQPLLMHVSYNSTLTPRRFQTML